MRTAVIVLICSVLSVRAALDAQSPTFEVASIRPNVSGSPQGQGLAGPQPGGRFIAIAVTLRRLVAGAYDDLQVVGGPAWIDSDRFDINARAEGDRPPSEIVRMVRSLLTDRFKLVLHTDTREMPVYVLTTARRDRRLGPKLRESDAKCAQDARNFIPQLAPGPPPCGDFRLGARLLTARGMTMARLAQLLRGRVGRPVADRTELAAMYDLELEWSWPATGAPWKRRRERTHPGRRLLVYSASRTARSQARGNPRSCRRDRHRQRRATNVELVPTCAKRTKERRYDHAKRSGRDTEASPCWLGVTSTDSLRGSLVQEEVWDSDHFSAWRLWRFLRRRFPPLRSGNKRPRVGKVVPPPRAADRVDRHLCSWPKALDVSRCRPHARVATVPT
jgi:uncharacterized protein (TIGR03435 family)